MEQAWDNPWHDYDVPVIFLGTRKAAEHRVDLSQFRRQLCDALGK